MKKLLLYLFSFLCLSLFALSQSKSFMEWWADYRLQKLHLPYTRSLYGDLYSSCFLPQYMDTAYHLKLTEYKTSKKNIDLYILHDSYLAIPLKKENFIGVDSLILSDFRGDGVRFKLNKKKKNILIIECSERTAEWRINDIQSTYKKLYTGKLPSQENENIKTQWKNYTKYLFNPLINQNLEFNLFDYEFLKPIKEAKAVLNFKWFNRTPKDVAVTGDKKYLLLNETVDPHQFESSF